MGGWLWDWTKASLARAFLIENKITFVLIWIFIILMVLHQLCEVVHLPTALIKDCTPDVVYWFRLQLLAQDVTTSSGETRLFYCLNLERRSTVNPVNSEMNSKFSQTTRWRRNKREKNVLNFILFWVTGFNWFWGTIT